MNAEFLENLMAQQNTMLKTIMDEMQGKKGGNGGGGGAYPDERRFRDMEVFRGKEDQYKEWPLKFKDKIKQYSIDMRDLVVKAEESTEEIDVDLR